MTNKIIGLSEIIKNVDNNIKNKDVLKHCGLPPRHILCVGLKSGNGRSMVTEYITDVYYEKQLRYFTALDYSLEFNLTGKIDNINEILSDIETAAVYKPEFEGVIGIGIDALTECPNDSHTNMFIDELEHIGQFATLIVFIDGEKKNANAIIDKLKKSLHTVDVINVKPYTTDELVEITKITLADLNVKFTEKVDNLILRCINEKNISTAKECVFLAKELSYYIDASDLTLKLYEDKIDVTLTK